MLLPPPSTRRGRSTTRGSASASRNCSTSRTDAKNAARASTPNVLNVLSETPVSIAAAMARL
jgi:hypothetical protein